jgi:PAS domain S-box-containing protein
MRQIITKGLASIYTDVPTLRPGTIEAYALALASAGVATVVRLAIDPYVMGAECLPFFPAVIITALIGGRDAGLFCVALSTAAVVFLQMPPLTLLLFVLLAIFLVILITRMRLAIQRELAAHALQASKDCLQSALDAARLGSWRYDARHRVFSWDARSKDIFGVPENGATVEEFMNWVHPDDVEGVWAAYHRALNPAQPEQSPTQFRLRRGDGKVCWVETQGLTYLEGAGRAQQVVGFIGTVQDITARKSAEEAQARLAAIVTSSADAIVGETLDGIVTSWNEAAERMFGYSADEMIGQSILRVVPSDRQGEEDMILSRMAQSETIERHEMMLVAKDERTFNASITISPIRDAEGRNIGCSKIIRDITERKQMEARLAEREAQLALFVEHAPVGIAMFDDKMRFLAVSRRFLSDRELGNPTEIIGRSVYEIIPDMPPRWRESDVRVLAGEELSEEEDFFPRQDGRIYWVRWSMKPWRTVSGRIGGAMLFAEVITEQVEARRALAESEARFRSSLLYSPVPIMLFDDQEKVLAVSTSWLEASGYSREDLSTIEDWTARAYGERQFDMLEGIRWIISAEPEAQPNEQTIRTKDGRERRWSFVTSAMGTQSDGRRVFVCVAQDVTERKAHEEQVRLLMREVNHRAKNMLSLVQAIARQTAAPKPEDFIGCFTQRIQALAANQDLLIRNEWKGVDVEELVRAQLAHFADIVGSRIVVHGQKLHLNAAAAQAIGLTLHELATNAGKYGALSMDAGRVDVGWRLDGDIFAIAGPSATVRLSHGRNGVASAARLSTRWRSGPSAVRSSLITLPQVWGGA